MANRNDSHMATPRKIKRMLALMEANGQIENAHRRGEILRLMQSAHGTWQKWHKKMLTTNDNVDIGNDDARPEQPAQTPAAK